MVLWVLSMFAKNEQNYIFEKKMILISQCIHIFALDNFIVSETRAKKRTNSESFTQPLTNIWRVSFQK